MSGTGSKLALALGGASTAVVCQILQHTAIKHVSNPRYRRNILRDWSVLVRDWSVFLADFGAFMVPGDPDPRAHAYGPRRP